MLLLGEVKKKTGGKVLLRLEFSHPLIIRKLSDTPEHAYLEIHLGTIPVSIQYLKRPAAISVHLR